jgi:enoyl-[acyl-carrier protein] reductase I
MLSIDLTDKRAFVAGIADDAGFGFAIAKHLAIAGATVTVGTWPPVFRNFTNSIQLGKMKEALRLPDGGALEFERIYPFDGDFDTEADVPPEVRVHRRYKEHTSFSIQGVADLMNRDFGERPLDIVVHSFANGPEVRKPLLQTSRRGYLSAVGSSAYSFVSMVRTFGPLLRDRGSFLNLSFIASERVVPGYGGGMSSAKAALESDTKTLAFEAGRIYGARVNCISAGVLASRAASAIGFIGSMIDYGKRNSPLAESTAAADVGVTAAFLSSELARGITGSIVYVDKGLHVMGFPVDLSPRTLEHAGRHTQ